MFSIFSQGDPKAQNFHPSTSGVAPQDLFGALTPADLSWVSGNGVETQIFYNFTPEGKFVMVQVIHALVGIAIYPTTQFVVHVYDPETKQRIFNSTNVSNFAPLPDKLSSKSNEFTIVHSTVKGVESYTVSARPNADVQVSVTIARSAEVPGWRIGNGPHGGRSFFGKNTDKPDGFVVHRFWPHTAVSGTVTYKGKVIDVAGPGMLVMGIQGMRPDNVASRWNFAHFQSQEAGGVSAIQMEFTTTKGYGPAGSGSGNVKVNIGSLVVGGKLVAVTGETRLPGTQDAEGDVVSRAYHLDPQKDTETGYLAPTRLRYSWRGPSLVQAGQSVGANIELDVGPPNEMKGLVEKVDLLAEVPGPVKLILSAAAGIKPIIYQWVNPVQLVLKGKDLVPGSDGEEVTVKGWLNNEATFIHSD